MRISTSLLASIAVFLLTPSIRLADALPGGSSSRQSSKQSGPLRQAAPPTAASNLRPAAPVAAPPLRLPPYLATPPISFETVDRDTKTLVTKLKAMGYEDAEATHWRVNPRGMQNLERAVHRQITEMPRGSRQFIPLVHVEDAAGQHPVPTKVVAMPLHSARLERVGLVNYADRNNRQTAALLGVSHAAGASPYFADRETPHMALYGFAEISNAPQLHKWLPSVHKEHDIAHDLDRILRIRY